MTNRPPRRPEIQAAYDALRARDLARAKTLIMPLLRTNPNDVDALLLFSYAETDPTRQIKALDRLLSIQPAHPQAAKRLTELRAAQSSFDLPTTPAPSSHQRGWLPIAILIGLCVIVLAIGVVFLLSRGDTSSTVNNNNPDTSNKAAPHPEWTVDAENALYSYIMDNQPVSNVYQIVNKEAATNPVVFTPANLLNGRRELEEAWCVIVTPPLDLGQGQRVDRDHFVVGREAALWEVVDVRTLTDADGRAGWLRGGCTSWDAARVLATPNPTTEALTQWVAGEYVHDFDGKMSLSGGQIGSVQWTDKFGVASDSGQYEAFEDYIVITGMSSSGGPNGRYYVRLENGQVVIVAERGGYAWISERPGLVVPTNTPPPTNTPAPTATRTNTPTITPTSIVSVTETAVSDQMRVKLSQLGRLAFTAYTGRGSNQTSQWSVFTVKADGTAFEQISKQKLSDGYGDFVPVWWQGSVYYFHGEDYTLYQAAQPSPKSFRTFDKGIGSWVVSPDGQQIIYQQGSRLYFMNVASGDTTPKGNITDASQPAWSPDGSRIAFFFDGRIGAEFKRGLVYVAVKPPLANGSFSYSNKDMQFLYTPDDDDERIFSPRYSPDGTHIAFTQEGGKGTGLRLCIVDANGGKPACLVDNVYGGSSIDWSPDGAFIAYSADGVLSVIEVATQKVIVVNSKPEQVVAVVWERP